MKALFLLSVLLLGSLQFVQAEDIDIDSIFNHSEKKDKKSEVSLDGFIKDSKKSASEAQKDFFEKYEYVSEEEKKKISTLGYCYSIRNEDLKLYCIAINSGKQLDCYAIRNEDLKRHCIAINRGKQLDCYDIRNEDLRNHCIAINRDNVSDCYSIRNKDRKYHCIGIINQEVNDCYAVENEDLRNDCIACVQKRQN